MGKEPGFFLLIIRLVLGGAMSFFPIPINKNSIKSIIAHLETPVLIPDYSMSTVVMYRLHAAITVALSKSSIG